MLYISIGITLGIALGFSLSACALGLFLTPNPHYEPQELPWHDEA